MPNTSEVARTESTDANPHNRRTRLVVLWALAVILAVVTAGMLIYLRAKSDVEAYYNELIGSSVPTAVTTVTFEKISFSSESWITLHFRGEFETPSHSADLSVDAEGAADSEVADDTEDIAGAEDINVFEDLTVDNFRAEEMINASASLRHIPEIWERIWLIDGEIAWSLRDFGVGGNRIGTDFDFGFPSASP